MPRPSLIIGLVASFAIHAALLAIPARPSTAPAAKPVPLPVEIVETALADVAAPADPAEPVVDAPKHEPKPEPEPQPEPTPDAVPTVERTPPRAEPDPPPKPRPVRAEPRQIAHPTPAAPPQPTRPDLTRMLERARAALPAGGDLSGATGEPGPKRPELRIDWGDAAHAVAVLDAGAMRLVVVRGPASGVVIDDEIAHDDGAWKRRDYEAPITTRFSNRLRIVDDVPAFAGAFRAAGLSGDEHLAVLVPDRVERLLQSAELRAAVQSGLEPEHIRSVGGRFALVDGSLVFETRHVQPRSGANARRDKS